MLELLLLMSAVGLLGTIIDGGKGTWGIPTVLFILFVFWISSKLKTHPAIIAAIILLIAGLIYISPSWLPYIFKIQDNLRMRKLERITKSKEKKQSEENILMIKEKLRIRKLEMLRIRKLEDEKRSTKRLTLGLIQDLKSTQPSLKLTANETNERLAKAKDQGEADRKNQSKSIIVVSEWDDRQPEPEKTKRRFD